LTERSGPPNLILFSFLTYLLFGLLSLPSGPPGAQLLVEQLGPGAGAGAAGEADGQKENPNVFLVGALRQRLLSGAEDLGLFKEFSDGSMRAFTYANRDNFKDFKGTGGEWRR